MLSNTSSSATSLRICVADAASTVGAALVQELAHGRFRSSFRSIIALESANGSASTTNEWNVERVSLSSLVMRNQDGNAAQANVATALAPLLASCDCICIVPPHADANAAPSEQSERLQFCRSLIAACEAARIDNVVLVSHAHPEWVSATSSPRLFEFRQIEDALKASTVAGHCILRPALLQQRLAPWISAAAASGVLALPLHRGALAPVHVADVARTAAAIFASRTAHHGPHMCPSYRSSVHVLTGPSALTGQDLACALSSVIGRPIEYASNSRNEARRQLERSGVARVDADLVLEVVDAARRDASQIPSLLMTSGFDSGIQVDAVQPSSPVASSPSSTPGSPIALADASSSIEASLSKNRNTATMQPQSPSSLPTRPSFPSACGSQSGVAGLGPVTRLVAEPDTDKMNSATTSEQNVSSAAAGTPLVSAVRRFTETEPLALTVFVKELMSTIATDLPTVNVDRSNRVLASTTAPIFSSA